MSDVLTADDPLYEELYDVEREAAELGNLSAVDLNTEMNALRVKAPVQKGLLRDLMGEPGEHRHRQMIEGREAYTCFSFAACNAAFRDNERFSSRVYHYPAAGERIMGLLELDEPEHRAIRSTVQPMFIKPQAMTWWRQHWINEIVHTIVDHMKTRERAELNLDLCARVPVHTVTRAIGLDRDQSLPFRQALMRSGGQGRVTPEQQRDAGVTVERMLAELIAQRRAKPQEDVVSGMVQAEFEMADGTWRKLTDREVLINARLIMLAGGGTSWRQMGITLWALLTRRDQLEAVKADRSLVDRAIEESLRWNATDPVFTRIVTVDTELEGFALPAGAVLDICLGAANRDPTRWENPDEYDLHRPIQNHLGFGMGAHQCLGMNVARSEINLALNALFDAFPNMRLDPDQPAPFLTGGLEQRGISGLHVLLH